MMANEEKIQNTALIKAAEIAFETEYHLNASMMDEECACEIASKVYREICGDTQISMDSLGLNLTKIQSRNIRRNIH